jgi:hypothetical protein
MKLLRKLAVVIFLLSPMSANAASITGEIAFGSSTVGADWTTATSIDFLGVNVTASTGDFAGVPFGTFVTIQDPFLFDPASSGTINPFWAFTSGGLNYSFALEEWTITQRTPSFLDLSGHGTVSITGYEDTPFNWTLSLDESGTVLAAASMTNAVNSIPPDPLTTVQIDIKPGSDPNCFNINGHGVIPVAVLSDETFDASTIDVSTISFGGLDVRVRGNKGPMCSIEDANGDGSNDLVCQFQDNPENWDVGDDEATLTGNLQDGTEIEGTDSICIVP